MYIYSFMFTTCTDTFTSLFMNTCLRTSSKNFYKHISAKTFLKCGGSLASALRIFSLALALRKVFVKVFVNIFVNIFVKVFIIIIIYIYIYYYFFI